MAFKLVNSLFILNSHLLYKILALSYDMRHLLRLALRLVLETLIKFVMLDILG